jgi:hypothetical protein
MIVGVVVVLLLALGVGSVAAAALLGGEPEAAANRGEVAAAEDERNEPPDKEATPEAEKVDEGQQAGQDTAQKTEKVSEPTEDDGPAPGYNLVETPDGGLSAEIPSSWGVETGENSEKEGTGPGTWSYHVGEYLFSSITTAPNLDAWYSTGTSGPYFVAARELAQYSDYELTNSLFNAGKATTCAEEGPYEDYDREPLAGKLQTWYGCGEDGATVYTLAAYPEGRECVLALVARVSEEADREAIEHLVDAVEVDCGRITSEPLAPSSSSASASASASASGHGHGLLGLLQPRRRPGGARRGPERPQRPGWRR